MPEHAFDFKRKGQNICGKSVKLITLFPEQEWEHLLSTFYDFIFFY